MKTHAHVSRSLLKSVTFRAIILVSDFTVVFLLTGQIAVTTALVIITNFSSTIIYFLHERVWERISFGLKKK